MVDHSGAGGGMLMAKYRGSCSLFIGTQVRIHELSLVVGFDGTPGVIVQALSQAHVHTCISVMSKYAVKANITHIPFNCPWAGYFGGGR